MVSELHVRGYQRLRIAPGMSPNGGAWRCAIAPVENFSKDNGAIIVNHSDLIAFYSLGKDSKNIGDVNAEYLTPSQLARIFIDKSPEKLELLNFLGRLKKLLYNLGFIIFFTIFI